MEEQTKLEFNFISNYILMNILNNAESLLEN